MRARRLGSNRGDALAEHAGSDGPLSSEVHGRGLEPLCLAAAEPKSAAYANFATRAGVSAGRCPLDVLPLCTHGCKRAGVRGALGRPRRSSRSRRSRRSSRSRCGHPPRRQRRHTPTGVLRTAGCGRLSIHDRSRVRHGVGASWFRGSPPIALVHLGGTRRPDLDARRGSERPGDVSGARPRSPVATAVERPRSGLRAYLGASAVGASVRPSLGPPVRPSVEDPLILHELDRTPPARRSTRARRAAAVVVRERMLAEQLPARTIR